MTLNGVIALILRFYEFYYFYSFAQLLANYVTVVEERPIMSTRYCPQFHSSTFGQN